MEPSAGSTPTSSCFSGAASTSPRYTPFLRRTLMTTAVYVRVSTQRQSQAQTMEHPLTRLRTHVETQEKKLPSEWIFRDAGSSGATVTRPGLDRLRDAVR